MSIYDLITSINDCENIIFSLFDCNTENLICLCVEDAETYEFSADELMFSNYAFYEIGSTDMWIDNGKIHIELNIEMEDEDND